MPDATASVDVVVVAYRSAATIREAVLPLVDDPIVAGVVVVDHGDDGSADLAATLGAATLVDPTNPGFGAGQNRGVAKGSARYVLLLNPDAVVVPWALAQGVVLLDGEADVAAVQGVVTGPDGRPERSAGRALRPVHLVGRALGLKALLRFGPVRRVAALVPGLADHAVRVPSGPQEVEALAATALLVRRGSFEPIGGFDESYFLYGEDMDLCWRLRDLGWRLVTLPVPWARHMNGASSATPAERERHWWRGTLQYTRRWWSWPARAVARASWWLVWLRLPLGGEPSRPR